VANLLLHKGLSLTVVIPYRKCQRRDHKPTSHLFSM